MEYRYSVKAWRGGEAKSKSGYRTIPLTEEAVAILNKQKEKNKRTSEISNEWEEFVFLCRKGTPVKTVHMIQHCLRFVIKRYEHFKINSLGKEKPTTTLFQQVP